MADDPVFSAEDARELVSVTRKARNYQGGVLLSEQGGLTPADMPVVRRYRELCQRLGRADANLLGFRQWTADASVLTSAQAEQILDAVVRPLDGIPDGWQRRGGCGKNEMSGVPGTRRKTFGVELDRKYRVIQRSEMPDELAALGRRLLARCAASNWPYSRGDAATLTAPEFEQAYIQRYSPLSSTDPSSTLGFHFDSFGTFGELIVGVTLVGEAKLLLRKTGPSLNGDFVPEPATTVADPRTLVLPLPPLSAYALTGISRYDLKHAIVNDGNAERISVTFRSVRWRRAASPRRSPKAHAASAGNTSRDTAAPTEVTTAAHAAALTATALRTSRKRPRQELDEQG